MEVKADGTSRYSLPENRGIYIKKKKKKKRLIAIGFSIYIQIPSAPTFPLPRPDIGPTLTFPPVTVTPEDGAYFSSRVNLPLTSVKSYLYYDKKLKFPF